MLKKFKYTYKNTLILFNNEFTQEIGTTNSNITPEELFEKYIKIKEKEYFMQGVIKLVKIEEI